MSVVVCVMPPIFLIFGMRDIYDGLRLIRLHSLKTVPIIGIIIMWGLLIWTAKSKDSQDKFQGQNSSVINTMSSDRIMGVIVQRLVIILLICYLPYLCWRQYFYGMSTKELAKLSRKVKMIATLMHILVTYNDIFSYILYYIDRYKFRECRIRN